ncbi:MAG: 30S ribosomal protein S3 [Clostridia bacterium]|nr:30S ribosomal protein S3 [Clostridia bacterium]
MGQKVNPHGLRVGVIQDWDSRWFENDKTFGDTLVSDYKVRKYLKELLYGAGVPKIEIERTAANVKVNIHCAKPGMVIGRGGSEIDKLRASIEKIVNKPVSVSVTEVRQPDLNAQLVAESVAAQLEKRIAFRRAMKQSIGRTMRLGAKGIKIMTSGRLGGAEIARSENYHEGTIPLQTIRADIDYGFAEANTTYGKIGVKCWIYKGEVLADRANNGERSERRERRGERRGDRRNGERNDRRPGGDRRNGERRPGGDRRTGAPRQAREGGAKDVTSKES